MPTTATIQTPRTWAEPNEPSPEQIAAWIEAMTHDERVEIGRQMLVDRAAAGRCYVEGHDSRLLQCQQDHVAG